MNKFAKSAMLAATVSLAPLAAAAADWTPPGPIKMMIGFAAGGGADTQARLIAQAVEERTGWTILPEQVTGNSGLNLAVALAKEPADGTAIGMVVSETLSYNAVVTGEPELQFDRFTLLATTAAFQTGLVAMADGDFSTWEKVRKAAADGRDIRFGTATTRQADLAYHLSKETGIDFNIVSVKGGADIMNGLRAGDLDIGWVAGAQAKPVRQGEMTNVATAIATPLAETPDAPSIRDIGSDFELDGYFMFIAPHGLPEEARAALAAAIEGALTDPSTEAHKMATNAFGGPAVLTGADLEGYMERAVAATKGLIAAVAD